MKKNLKNILVLAASGALALSAMMFTSCGSTQTDGVDPAITKGVEAWNRRGPSTAENYWTNIADEKVKQKYLNYIKLYNDGVAALDSTDSMKATQEGKLISACNTALSKFSALDAALQLDDEVCQKGTALTVPRINKLLEAEKVSEAKKMYKTAKQVYGASAELDTVGKEIDAVSSISAKKKSLKDEAEAASQIENVDDKIAAYQKIVDSIPSLKKDVAAAAAKSGAESTAPVKSAVKGFNNTCQDVVSQRKLAIREKAYEYKEQIGDVFARQLEGTGSGKNGAFTNQEILNHYQSVKADMQVAYDQLLEFQKKYPEEIDANVIKDVNAQKTTLQSKITVVEKEIAREKEIASRGKFVGMIGLFNAEAGDAKKSKPAKFSGSTKKKPDYLWGIVDIAPGAMNDLVITMKDNRNVHVFNQNTKSGKQIEKLGLKDLISRQNKVGNSWPVMNAREALNGSVYYVQVEQGKSDVYSGEAVVYASFITRSR